MKRQVLKSNSAIVVVGDAPAWKINQETGRLLSLVQNCDFSITNDRQKIKQIGSQSYSVNNVARAPEVSLSLDYYLTPYINNELLFGFNGQSSTYEPAFSNIKSRNQNIYLIVDTDDERDGVDQFKTGGEDFSGYNALTFGNCYVNKYSVSYQLNNIPIVSVGLAASNARFESLTGNEIPIPAINSVSGNNSGYGFLDLTTLNNTLDSGYISGYSDGRSEYNAPVAVSNASSFYLQNLQVGGVNLDAQESPILQSFSLDIDLARTSLYGLGSNYVYDRKLQYPINGQVQIVCLVSGVSSGNFESILNSESGYSLEVAFCDSQKLSTGFYKIQNAKLDSVNYAMQINNIMQFNAAFSFEINDESGFLIKREPFVAAWQNMNIAWQDLTINWSEAF